MVGESGEKKKKTTVCDLKALTMRMPRRDRVLIPPYRAQHRRVMAWQSSLRRSGLHPRCQRRKVRSLQKRRHWKLLPHKRKKKKGKKSAKEEALEVAAAQA